MRTVLLGFVPAALAGLQVPLTIINMSPFDAEVDMTLPENCIKHDFNPIDLQHYYDSWPNSDLVAQYGDGHISSDMNQFLQLYKSAFNIQNLGDARLPMSGVHTLSAIQANVPPAFGVFETEMAGSGSCLDSHSWKEFKITANGVSTILKLHDPPTSNWEIIKDPDSDSPLVVDIGPGGKADPFGIVMDVVVTVIAAATAAVGFPAIGLAARAAYLIWTVEGAAAALGWGSVLTTAAYGGFFVLVGSGGEVAMALRGTTEVDGAPATISPSTMGFYDVYGPIGIDKRNACLLGDNIFGQFECLAASTSIVIQSDGTVFAVPMPQISRAWD